MIAVGCTILPTNLQTRSQYSEEEIALVPQLGHVAFYLNAGITAVAISPDKKTAATGGDDGSIKFWDLPSGILSRSIRAHIGGVGALAFSPDGQILASGGGDRRVRLWNIRTGQVEKTLEGHETRINCLAFSLDGELLASGSGSYADTGTVSDNTIRIWSAHTGLPRQILRGHHQQIISLAFNGEGNQLASGSFDKTIIIWSIATGQPLRSIGTEATNSLSFSPDGKRIASAAAQRIIFWNANTGGQIGSINYQSYTSRVAFTPDWHFVAIDGELWDVATGVKIRSLVEVDGRFHVIAISNDGSLIVRAGYSGFVAWDAMNGTVMNNISSNPAFTTGVVFNKSGDKLAWSRNSAVYVWDINAGRPQNVFTGHEDFVNEVAFSPDGQSIASCSDTEIKLWSLTTGKLVRNVVGAANGVDGYQSLQFSPNGSILAVGGSINDEKEGVTLWSTRTWRARRTLVIKEPEIIGLIRRAHPSPVPGGPATEVHSVSFSPDGRFLAAGAENNNVVIWDLNRWREFKILSGHDLAVNSVAFSHDGKRLVSGSFDQTVKVWDLSRGQVSNSMNQHHGHVTSVRFSPDDQTVLSGSVDQAVRLWSAVDGKSLATLEAHDGPITFVAFSPDGKLAVSTGFDGLVNLWSVANKVLLSTILTFDDRSWINFSPDGFYSGSPEATKHIAWRRGDAIYPGEALASRRLNPDLLRARTLGASPPVVARSSVFSPIKSAGEVIPLAESEKKLMEDWKDHKFYALVIGIGHYKHFDPLETSLKDALDLKRVLEERYDFEVKLLPDATKEQILGELERYEKTLTPNSSLLIFFAGHGIYLDLGDRKEGVWLPVDAKSDNRYNWIRSTDILESIKLMSASQILIVSDSCFSGTLFTRSAPLPQVNERPEVLFNLLKRKSWTLVASGGNEPVDDRGEDGHSVFARAVLKALKTVPQNVFTIDYLFHKFIYDDVKDHASQEPKIRPIPGFEDDNGSFVFMRRRTRSGL